MVSFRPKHVNNDTAFYPRLNQLKATTKKKCIHLYSAFGESRRMIQNYQKPLFTVIPEWWHSCLKWVNLSPRGYLIGNFFLRLLFCPMDNIVFAKSVCYCQALCCHMTRYVDTWYHAVNRMPVCICVRVYNFHLRFNAYHQVIRNSNAPNAHDHGIGTIVMVFQMDVSPPISLIHTVSFIYQHVHWP